MSWINTISNMLLAFFLAGGGICTKDFEILFDVTCLAERYISPYAAKLDTTRLNGFSQTSRRKYLVV